MVKRAMVGAATGRVQSLEQLAQRFIRWRARRVRGEHIPASLWAAAAVVSKEHGLSRIAHELRLDPELLKKRIESGGAERVIRAGQRGAQSEFVELFAAPASTAPSVHECVLEIENLRGAKMRIELNGKGVAGLVGLCNAFWGAS